MSLTLWAETLNNLFSRKRNSLFNSATKVLVWGICDLCCIAVSGSLWSCGLPSVTHACKLFRPLNPNGCMVKECLILF
jgi:hypothetical protein